MQAISTNIGPGQWLRGAGLLGLYGGSVAIAIALILAGWMDGSIGHVAGLGTGAVTDAMVHVMAVLGGIVRQI